jgi:hypothetical protein
MRGHLIRGPVLLHAFAAPRLLLSARAPRGRVAGGGALRPKIGMEDVEKTRRDDIHNALLGMGMCRVLSREAALEIGVGTLEIGVRFCIEGETRRDLHNEGIWAISSSMQRKRSNIPRSQRELELVPRHLAPHAPRGVGTRAHLSLCLVVTFRLRSDCGLRCGSGRRLGLGVRSSGTHQHALCGGQRRDDLPPVARGRYPYIPGARVRGSLVMTPVARGSGCGGRRGRGGADGRAWFGLWSGVGLGG